MPGVQRCLGVPRHTLSNWLVDWISQLPALRISVAPARPNDVLELDELWSFVGQRQQKRWLWIALCRRTRQVVAFVIGDRSAASCGNEFPIRTAIAARLAISGIPTSKSLILANIAQLVKKAAKQRM